MYRLVSQWRPQRYQFISRVEDIQTFPSHVEKLAEQMGGVKCYAAMQTGDTVDRAVVCVPSDFGDDALRATIAAANDAGLKRCVVLQEPVAAAMAHGLTRSSGEGEAHRQQQRSALVAQQCVHDCTARIPRGAA